MHHTGSVNHLSTDPIYITPINRSPRDETNQAISPFSKSLLENSSAAAYTQNNSPKIDHERFTVTKPTSRNLLADFDACTEPNHPANFLYKNIEIKTDCNVSSNMIIDCPNKSDDQDYLNFCKTFRSQELKIEEPVPPSKELEIDLDAKDMYTQETFRTLLKQSRDENLPYFIVVWVNKLCSKPEIADAKQFMRQYFKYDNQLSPITKKKVRAFNIYKSNKTKDTFKLFCNQSSLRTKHDHAAKYINACSIDLEPSLRGEERYYLHGYYEKKASDYLELYCDAVNNSPDEALLEEYSPEWQKTCDVYEKAHFWLTKAIEDHEPSAFYAMSENGFNGTILYEPSTDVGLKYLALAVHAVSDYDKRAGIYTEAYLNIIQSDFTYLKSEEEYCIDRLNRIENLHNP